MLSKISSKRILFIVGVAGTVSLAIIILFLIRESAIPLAEKAALPKSYHANIIKASQENINFRQVLFTGTNSQLVVMSIPPGGEAGEETHKYTEQTLFFLSGKGEGMLDDKKFSIVPGDVVVVVPGTKHNFWNTGTENLKIYTVYAPPNHIYGRVHRTKSEADADTADEAVGEIAPTSAR